MTYLWLDLETTGLDPTTCSVIEVAAIVTDEDLTELDRWSTVVGYSNRPIRWEPGALKMHAASGLAAEHADASQIDWQSVLGDIAFEYSELTLAGRNVHFNRQFLTKAALTMRLSHRHLDVTTIYLMRPDMKPSDTVHRAMDDIEADLDAARQFRALTQETT